MPTERPADVPVLIASTIDCNDLEGMTAFWGDLLGVETVIHDHFGFLSHAPGRKVTLWLQRVEEPRVGKNRVHLDLAVRDLDAACVRVVDLGGGTGETQEWGGFVWRTCTDPEGNVFDIMQAPAVEDGSA